MPSVDDPLADDAVAVSAESENTAAPMKIVFIDVGQGASTLIISPEGKALLIDAGPAGAGTAAVLPALARHGITHLTGLIATHYHADHIGGVGEVLRGADGLAGTADDLMPTDGIFDRGGEYEGTSPEWDEYLTLASGMRRSVSPGNRIDLGMVAVEAVAAGGVLASGTRVALEPFDENAASIGLVIEYGTLRMFIGGDITGGGGNPPYETIDVETPLAPLIGDVDVLAVSHHGSMTSTNQTFLDALGPEIAIISCGDTNDYFHPHRSVIERLKAKGTAIYQTEKCWLDNDEVAVTIAHGDIELTIDTTDPPSITLIPRP